MSSIKGALGHCDRGRRRARVPGRLRGHPGRLRAADRGPARARPGVRPAPRASGARCARRDANGAGQLVRVRRRQHQPRPAGCRVSVPFERPVYVAGAAALTPFGAGLARARGARGNAARRPQPRCRALAPDDDPCQPRHRKMMSRAAYLAAAVVRDALREPAVAGLDDPPGGVGSSSASARRAARSRSSSDAARERRRRRLSLERFGDAGLRAANPLLRVPADEQLHAVPRRDPGGARRDRTARSSRAAPAPSGRCARRRSRVAEGDATARSPAAPTRRSTP